MSQRLEYNRPPIEKSHLMNQSMVDLFCNPVNWQPWRVSCLLMLSSLLALPPTQAASSTTPTAGVITMPVDPQSNPSAVTTPSLSVRRTPAVLVAGQPFTIEWSSNSSVTGDCNNPGGGYLPVETGDARSGKITGLASSFWVGRIIDCTWVADNGERQTTFVDRLQTTGQAQPANPVNDAALDGQTVSTSMTGGQSYPVTVRMKNMGNTTWVAGEYKLGAQNPQDNLVWGVQRVELSRNVAPNDIATFNFNITAPANSGSPRSVNLQWAMVQEYRQWFGAASNNVAVTVVAATPAPTITVTRTPATLTATQGFNWQWSTTHATSVTRVCTSTGTGYVDNSTHV